jgi:hypothetical protein
MTYLETSSSVLQKDVTVPELTELLIDRPDVHVFWSAYDPLDLASDSIDPLGFMGGYVALADRILPGFTTITTVPRYASMICLALKLAREAVGDGDGNIISVRRRLIIEKLKLFERAWGLACGLAEEDSAIGAKATDGLRGIRAVHRWRELNAKKEKVTLAFDLLSNQVRYGGIGAYSTFLESLHLADMETLTLRPMGEELADAFPSPDAYALDVLRDGAKLTVEGLRDWGRQAHTGTLSTPEAQILRRALQGGEEAEFDDDTRWTMLRLLRACESEKPKDEPQLLGLCLSSLRHSTSNISDPVGRANARIGNALSVIEPYERMYQCVLFVFDQIRLRGTDSGQVDLQTVMECPSLVGACTEMKRASEAFLAQLEAASGNESVLGSARQALQKLGIVEFAQTLRVTKEPINLGQEVLRRHLRVQEDKFDGGLPKSPWVRLEPGPGSAARLTSQRFGLTESHVTDGWRAMTRHPYRTFGAKRFIRLCRIQ